MPEPARRKTFAEHRRELHGRVRAMASSDNRPSALGAAVALGIFFGCSPLYGFQTALVLLFATLLRLNPLAAILGSQVSFPPLGFLIVGSEVALGEWFRYGRWAMPPMTNAQESLHWLWDHALFSWVLGSLAIGGGLALAGGGLSWALFRVLQALRRRQDRAGEAS